LLVCCAYHAKLTMSESICVYINFKQAVNWSGLPLMFYLFGGLGTAPA